MLSFSSSHKYYLYTPPTDMRKQFDGLAGLISQHFEQSIMEGDVFVFINKRRNRIKLLVWDHTGFVLYYKRLERGTFELPVSQNTNIQLSWSDLIMLLEGIELRSIKRRKRYKKTG